MCHRAALPICFKRSAAGSAVVSADFVERQPDGVHLKGDGQHDLDPKLTAAKGAGDLTVLILGAAIDFIGEPHGAAVEDLLPRSRG